MRTQTDSDALPTGRGERGRCPRAAASSSTPTVLRRASAIIAPCLAACMSIAACASAAPYDPDRLGAGPVNRIGAICEDVMGLDPSEPLTFGMHTGVTTLDTWTSHYRGCVLSLSDSLASIDSVQAASEAAQACRAQGLEPGSPDLAVCVLRSTETARNPAAAPVAAASAPPDRGLLRASGSFYNASNRELSRRERLACAELGLEPASGPFTSCVRSLKATFFAIDNPVN